MKGIKAELGIRGPEQGHYPNVVYEQPIYKRMNFTGNCPIAENTARHIRENINRQ
jgi:predicted nucleotide-binding protein (sugar kinase/HSP70/actin superfamily)